MRAVFGFRRLSSSIDCRQVAPIPIQLSGGEFIETISSEVFSLSFVVRDQDDLAASLLASEDWTVGVVGKVFHENYPRQSDLLAQLLAEFRAGSCEVLRESFGEYVLVIVDQKKGDVFLFSDVLSIRPVFHYESAEKVVFGTDAWQLVSEDIVPPTLDLDAFCAWLLFDHVIGNRSIVKGLERLHPGSCLSLSKVGVKQKSYKRFHIDRRTYSESQLLGRIESAISGACSTVTAREKRLNCFLSGGFDSRYLLAERALSGRDLRAYTVRYMWWDPKHHWWMDWLTK